jgi:hypothetical protein
VALAVSLDRRGFEVLHGGQPAGFTEQMHAHDFDVRIMGGEITLIGDGKSETFTLAVLVPKTLWAMVAGGPKLKSRARVEEGRAA